MNANLPAAQGFFSLSKTVMAGLTLAILPFSFAQLASDDEEEIYELSPFTVDASDDQGYRATSTLAGTRLKTPLRDVGAAISVMTSEFFDDTGATDSQTLLSYALNTETSGAHGNFAGGNGAIAGGQRVDLADERTNPQNGQRVRGLATAQLTRNYFETDIAFDSYNTDRVTINRGPNSLLFGIGSAGGVINNATLRPSLTGNFGEFSVRLGERSSHRETFDYNAVLVDDRLGVRLAGVYDKFNYQQRPTFEEKERFYATVEGVLFENEGSDFLGKTVIRANYESGEITTNPPQVTPPGDGVSSWFSIPDPGPLEAITGTNFPAFFRDGSFVPKYTIDQRRPGLTRGNINGVAALPNFIQISLIYEQPTGSTGLSGTDLDASVMRAVRGFGGRPYRTWDYFVNSSLYHEGYLPNFVTASLPLHVFDNENMALSGTTNLAIQDFDASNVMLEQTFLNGKAGFEINYDQQEYSTFRRFPFNSGGFQVSFNDVVVDINEYRNDETPNPNVGRLMAFTSGNRQASILGHETSFTEREAARLTAFYDLDFTGKDGLKWLGRHVFTGVISNQRRDIMDQGIGAAWVSEDIDLGGSDYHFGNLNIGRRQVVSQVYLTPPLHNDASIQSFDDVRITNYIDIDLPANASVYNAKTYNRTDDTFFVGEMATRHYLNSFTRTRREIETEVIAVQSYLLDSHLVGLLGFRTDTQTNWRNKALVRNANGEVNFDESNVLDRLRDPITSDILPPEEGDTVTWSLVGHVPDEWMRKLGLPGNPRLSFHYNDSENFNPVGVRTDIEGFQIASPAGDTEEYGFSVELLDNKMSLRFNWFETNIINDTAEVDAKIHSRIGNWLSRWNDAENAGFTIEEALAVTPGNPAAGLWSSYEEAYADIVALLPANIQAIYNYRIENGDNEDDLDQIANPSATREFTSKGFEIDLVANITPNWRLMLNVGQQETVQNNIAPKVAAVASQINANILASPFADVWDAPILAESFTFTTRWQNENFNSLLATLSQEGTVSLEQREWRANLVTNYNFPEGPFAGFSVGGAVRWQSKAATGYPLVLDAAGIPLPDLANPFWGPDQLNGDVWVGYERKLFGDKLNWRIQLNVRNAFGDDDVIPVVTNPDGQLAVFRNSLPTEFFLTNTFRF